MYEQCFLSKADQKKCEGRASSKARAQQNILTQKDYGWGGCRTIQSEIKIWTLGSKKIGAKSVWLALLCVRKWGTKRPAYPTSKSATFQWSRATQKTLHLEFIDFVDACVTSLCLRNWAKYMKICVYSLNASDTVYKSSSHTVYRQHFYVSVFASRFPPPCYSLSFVHSSQYRILLFVVCS